MRIVAGRKRTPCRLNQSRDPRWAAMDQIFTDFAFAPLRSPSRTKVREAFSKYRERIYY